MTSQEDRNNIIAEMKGIMQINEQQEMLVNCLLSGEAFNPISFITLNKVVRLRNTLNDIGITNIFDMGENKSLALWQLAPNAISNYQTKKRMETINNIINNN